MLKALFEKYCHSSLALALLQDGEEVSVLVTPRFDEAGLLSSIVLEQMPPRAVENTAAAAEPQPDANQTQSQEQKGDGPMLGLAQQQQLRQSGAVEFDPVTGEPKAKTSEQV